MRSQICSPRCFFFLIYALFSGMKWNESGFRPPLCTYRLNWARRTSWGWWDDWDDTVLQTQNSKFEPWRFEAEHATSRSWRLPTVLTFTRGWGRNIFVSFKPPRPGTEPRTLAWKAAVLATTLGPPPFLWYEQSPWYLISVMCSPSVCVKSGIFFGMRSPPWISAIRFWTSDFEHQTFWKSDVLKIRFWTSDFGHQTLDIRLWTSDFGHHTLDIILRTSYFGHQTLRLQTSDIRLSNIRQQTSTVPTYVFFTFFSYCIYFIKHIFIIITPPLLIWKSKWSKTIYTVCVYLSNESTPKQPSKHMYWIDSMLA